MRIAALYDIHGNLPALEAVLDAVRDEGVDEVIVGGDVVPGPMPGGCVEALQGVAREGPPVRYIRGNGEAAVLQVCRGETPTHAPEQFHGLLAWVADQLGAEQAATLEAWPATLRVVVPGLGPVTFCHATPRDDNEIFTRDTPEDVLLPIFEATGSAMVVCGHTHMQFDRTIGRVRVVNAGSVGMPFGEPGAYWALLTDDGPRLRHTTYDLAAAARRIEVAGYPSEFEILRPPSASAMRKTFEAAAIK